MVITLPVLQAGNEGSERSAHLPSATQRPDSLRQYSQRIRKAPGIYSLALKLLLHSLDPAETEGVDSGEVRAESFRSWRHTKVTQATLTSPGVLARSFEGCVGRVTFTAWDCPTGGVPGAGQPETCLRVLGRGHGRGHPLPCQHRTMTLTTRCCGEGGTAWRPVCDDNYTSSRDGGPWGLALCFHVSNGDRATAGTYVIRKETLQVKRKIIVTTVMADQAL